MLELVNIKKDLKYVSKQFHKTLKMKVVIMRKPAAMPYKETWSNLLIA